ncbi:MAG: hypothetical protein QOH06_3727 [Acidobacteriota bacterium]|jgi:hypothetical protein|nr:hypothetical protein [Acidobacteriota bacterium]
MLYEKLNGDMRKMVDQYAQKLRPLDWNRRSDLLVQASLSFGEEQAPDKASLASRGFVTAVLERWAAPEVDDPRQALLYLTSLNPDHQALAKDYLDKHPEMREVVERELGAFPEE